MNFMKTLLIQMFILLFSFTLSEAQSLTFDILRYEARIEPDLSNKALKGKVTLNLKALTNHLTEIQLNAGALEIDRVSENKAALKFEKKPNLLIITLTKPAKLNENRKIEI